MARIGVMNMEVVGTKNSYASALYFFVGVIVAVLGIIFAVAYSIVAGIFFILLAVVLFCFGIYALVVPNDLIAVSENAIILLKTKQEIQFSDIGSILSRRANARGISYCYGEIIIETNDGKIYKQNLVDDVEEVAKTLNKKLRNQTNEVDV